MSFEPTQPQDGVDPNPFTLIDPQTIPYPLTDVWSLNYAAETLRTGGEELFGGAEDLRSTWNNLQAHYKAPESETLFAKMDPVVTRGEDIQSDLATVADALEDLAEAAATARRSLNTLRIEAQSLWNANHDKKVWWLTKDEETDEWALGENIRIKDAVNTAWSTFNTAENACASRISAVFGGPAYASPGQASGDDVLIYGLPPDAGERDMSLEHHLSLEGVNSNINDVTAWAGTEFHPSLADWGNPTGQALWDTVVTDLLWGSAVGLTSKLGFWHPDNGWRFDPSGRWENTKAAWGDAWMDTVGLVGVHDEHGWLWEPGEGGKEGWGAGWDRWTDNVQESAAEVWEGHTAWSTREDGVAYSNTTIGANAALMSVGLPLKALKIIAGAGVAGSMDTPTGPHGSGSHSSGSDPGSGSDRFTSRGGPGTRGWPSSPLPGAGEGGRSTGERFENPLTVLQESLLDPNRYRAPSSTPNTPVPDGGGDRPSQSPPAPQRGDTPQPQGGGTPQNRPGDEDTPHRPGDADTVASGGFGERPGAPASTTRPEGESQRGDSGAPRAEDGSERRPPRRDDAREGTGGPREEAEAERPEPATGGGEGGRGGDEPPNDRTGTGGDDGGGDDPNNGRRDDGGDRDQERPEPTNPNNQKPDHSGPMSPELRSELRDRIQQVPGFRQLGFDDKDYSRLFNSLESKRSTVGAQTADMILQGRLANVEGFSDMVVSLKNRDDLPARNQEMRIAMDLLDSGFPSDRIAFPGKNPITGEDLDVAVRGEDGRIEYGYQAKVVENPEGIRSALRKIKKQFPAMSEASHRGGIIEANFDMGELLDRDLRALHDAAKAENISFHVHFRDGTLDFPSGAPLYPTN